MRNGKALSIGLIVCAAVLAAAVLLSVSGVFGLGRYAYADAERYTAGEADLEAKFRNLDVDWLDGGVTIAYHSAQTVTLRERSGQEISGDMKLRWLLDGDTLRIRYARAGVRTWNLFGSGLKKELILTLPEGFALSGAKLHASSGVITIPSLQAEDVSLEVSSGEIRASADAARVTARASSGDIDLKLAGAQQTVDARVTSGSLSVEADRAETLTAGVTSGGIRVKAGQVGTLTLTSTSGDVHAEAGEAGQITARTTSGGITVRAAQFRTLEAEATSGGVLLRLPAEPGFTARVHQTSGKFSTGLPMTSENGAWVCGDGSAAATVRVTSGDVRIEGLE